MTTTPTMNKQGYSFLAGALAAAAGAATASAPQAVAASGCCDYELMIAEWQCAFSEGVCYFQCTDYGEDGCQSTYNCCC